MYIPSLLQIVPAIFLFRLYFVTKIQLKENLNIKLTITLRNMMKAFWKLDEIFFDWRNCG